MKPSLAISRASAGAAASFDPSSISGLTVWLKADALVLNNNDPVTTWADSTVNGWNATQTGTLRPLYKTNILNGKPVVRFDGVDDYMNIADFAASFPSAATVFLVAAYIGTNDTYDIFESSSVGDPYWRYTSGDSYMSLFRADRPNMGALGMPQSGNHYFTVESSASLWQMWLDGVSLGTQTPNYSAGAGSPEFLGGLTGHLFSGDIPELLVYNSALGSTDRGNVESYLKTKYGL